MASVQPMDQAELISALVKEAQQLKTNFALCNTAMQRTQESMDRYSSLFQRLDMVQLAQADGGKGGKGGKDGMDAYGDGMDAYGWYDPALQGTWHWLGGEGGTGGGGGGKGSGGPYGGSAGSPLPFRVVQRPQGPSPQPPPEKRLAPPVANRPSLIGDQSRPLVFFFLNKTILFSIHVPHTKYFKIQENYFGQLWSRALKKQNSSGEQK